MSLPGIATIQTYGGPYEDAHPVTNPLTDQGADLANQCFNDCAMMTGTSVRAWVKFTGATTTGGMTLLSHFAQWGGGPALAPTLVRNSTGNYSVTWPATVQDQLLAWQSVALRAGWANVVLASLIPNVSVTGNVATVNFYNPETAAAAEANGVAIDLFVI